MRAAIHYHPEAYTTAGPKLMGRNSAGESFLRGYLSHTQTDEFWVHVQKQEHAGLFSETVRTYGRSEPIKVVEQKSLPALGNPGVLFLPGPGIGEHARQRSVAAGNQEWSLCGVTHTISSATAMDALAELITAPIQPWDAVICTSTAVKASVELILQAQVDYLVSRLAITRIVLPKLPIIPLGVHTNDFYFTEAQKAAARAVLRVSPNTVVLLFMGRLSFHAKAHPLAMYQALESAVRSTGKSAVLIECGWHANEYIARAYATAAEVACPSVRVITLDGRKLENRQAAWAAADVFCSLSDNLQETFGITPIEAMAAGVPVVVSDWDGYRDTVRNGVDGFRIPTLMPDAGFAGDITRRYALGVDSYDVYCGHTCSLVAVDVQATAQAFECLFKNQDLRKKMGEAGRARAKSLYDWKSIIAQYESLWAELSEIRRLEVRTAQSALPLWTSQMDPFRVFANYSTKRLTPKTVLALAEADKNICIARVMTYRQLAMVNFANTILPSEDEIRFVINSVDGRMISAADLLVGLDVNRQPIVFRGLVWLVKLGILRVC